MPSKDSFALTSRLSVAGKPLALAGACDIVLIEIPARSIAAAKGAASLTSLIHAGGTWGATGFFLLRTWDVANGFGARRERTVDPSLEIANFLLEGNQLIAFNNRLRLHLPCTL